YTTLFRSRFVLRVAVRMPFQRGFTVGGLDLLQRCVLRNPKHFVIIAWIPFGHESFLSPLVHCLFGCGTGMDCYTDHCWTQHAAVKNVAGLEDLKDGPVSFLRGFGAVHRLMEVRVKRLADRVDAL